MSDSDTESGTENASALFEPLFSRPIIDVKTLEEDEMCLFSARAKLFRYDVKSDEQEWKERGTGQLKILQSADSGHCRVTMRRDKTLKICANHHILPCMQLLPIAGSTSGFVWKAPNDFADNCVKAQILGVRFRDSETARDFQKVFEKCRTSVLSCNKCGEKSMKEKDSIKSKEKSKTKGIIRVKEIDGSLTADLSELRIKPHK